MARRKSLLLPSKRQTQARRQQKVNEKILRIGTKHWVMYRNNFPCVAEIISIDSPRYYVHYSNFDKRLDEWISGDNFLTAKQIEALRSEGKIPKDFNATNFDFESSVSDDPSSTKESTIRTSTRRRRPERSQSALSRPSSKHSPPIDPIFAQLEKEHEEVTKIKNIQQIVIGRFKIDCWYFSPYPDEYSKFIDLMFICEKCLKYMIDEDLYAYHYHNCSYQGPPGKLIYLKDGLVVYELDGAVDGKQKLYCQNLCLLSKLFLDHKTLYYDVSPFLFYVLCEVTDQGVHPVGYFSKEKESSDGYNLACIMILPPFQKKGYGRFLIQLSYEITKRQEKTGSPEKPLSDLGKLSYQSFWSYELLKRLRHVGRNFDSITALSEQTAFTKEDILETLDHLGLLKQYRGQMILNLSSKIIDIHLKSFENKKFTLLDSECLEWP